MTFKLILKDNRIFLLVQLLYNSASDHGNNSIRTMIIIIMSSHTYCVLVNVLGHFMY